MYLVLVIMLHVECCAMLKCCYNLLQEASGKKVCALIIYF
jgi:hypothetical protein